MRNRLFTWLVLLLLAGSAGNSTQAAENTGPGLSVGSQAPEFSLTDQTGKKQTLGSFLEQQKKVALVFYRSADW